MRVWVHACVGGWVSVGAHVCVCVLVFGGNTTNLDDRYLSCLMTYHAWREYFPSPPCRHRCWTKRPVKMPSSAKVNRSRILYNSFKSRANHRCRSFTAPPPPITGRGLEILLRYRSCSGVVWSRKPILKKDNINYYDNTLIPVIVILLSVGGLYCRNERPLYIICVHSTKYYTTSMKNFNLI